MSPKDSCISSKLENEIFFKSLIDENMNEKIINGLERILMIDVFVVLLGFLWFTIAIIGRSIGIPLGWEIWYKLWYPVFNPAIGILFLGAFLTWLIKKIGQSFPSE